MQAHKVLDDFGGICTVMFTAAIRDNKFAPPQPAIKTYITLPDGDTYSAWIPIFTDWWPE